MAKKFSLTPTAGYIIVEPAAKETKTASGIYLPDNATGERPQQGSVIAIGADEVTDHGTKKTSSVKVGDTIIYKKWGGNEVKHDGVDYIFVKFDDILATIN